jgi:ATP-dependent RNA helicase DHX29
VVLMSATLDAALFAGYFDGAPVLHAEGRTFPVTRYFLEDCYQMTGYKLEADSPAALR